MEQQQNQQANEWSLIVGDAEQGKKVFRILQTIPEGVEKAAFSVCVFIDWKYGRGLPDAEIGAKLKRFEDFLALLDDATQNSLLELIP